MLPDRLLQRLSWSELCRLYGRDPDLLTSLGVPAGPSLAVCQGKGTKARVGDPTPFLSSVVMASVMQSMAWPAAAFVILASLTIAEISSALVMVYLL